MRIRTAAAPMVLLWLLPALLPACTNFIITKGASADGSVMITYSADSHEFYGELYHYPPGVHLPGAMREVYDWNTGKFLGRIPEAPVTYSVVGNMNEHQLSIGETTFTNRKELEGSKGLVDYGSLMYIALQRCRTAREAILLMGKLAEEHGYPSEGESFSVADPNEAWIFEIVSKGPDELGAVWVARRVPDGYISGHANQSRIRKFPLNDPENCLYSKEVISFARRKGWFDGKDADFSFADVYAPADFGGKRFCEARVWAMFNRAAPSLKIPADYVRGVPGAEPIPLWIKPDRKLSVRDVMELMRDHYEGTEFDMTQDVGAGPFALPYRWRPLTWKVDGVEYLHERATSTQQTGFSFVSQMRSWLPGPIGGVHWFGLDDTFSTVYMPMYCGIRQSPYNVAVGTGSFRQFSWDSAWWMFNLVANWAYSRYSDMIVDIQKVQRQFEGEFIQRQPAVEAEALRLYKESPEQARDYLTAYSSDIAERVTARWRKLFEELFVKYLDGNVRDTAGVAQHPPYPEAWYRRIVRETGDRYKVIEEAPKP